MSELRDAQLADDNIRPVVQWKESKEGRPEWHKSHLRKSYSQVILGSVGSSLSAKWCTVPMLGIRVWWPWVLAVGCTSQLQKRCPEEIAQRPHFWTPWHEEKTRPCERMLLLEWVQSWCQALVPSVTCVPHTNVQWNVLRLPWRITTLGQHLRG